MTFLIHRIVNIIRLKTTLINDITYKAKGKVIDINVYCNKDISETPNVKIQFTR